ncbi:uncharacterized protein PGTG_18104 [Puccinia graminis f. sp. tritici CRL 75-36-700-3]|uniref:Uncharacterized protein n=1 Tax=Puccinia graminis f. sp. tritici (strain CRL 75-36-700-3 / race SCCL) TaxID=418459 RepID=E3L6N2_PUCGT|nr:uncharacterized protein PGTG_18104 [Puccinia graminis f. sp. tritici CRL 75-36-700-3]EFP92207.1 hypothetical protein PGTG_18104 [Puccinia graminis f. sp. tritici CRL 75-36-700-3]
MPASTIPATLAFFLVVRCNINSQLPGSQFAAISLNQQLLSSFVSTGSAFVTLNFEASGNTATGTKPKRKRVQPDEDIKQWNQLWDKASNPFVASKDQEKPIPSSQQPVPLKKQPFYYFVPPARQHDPEHNVMHTSQEILSYSYKGRNHGTVIIVPQNKESKTMALTWVEPCGLMDGGTLQGMLVALMQKSNYVAKDEAVAVREANNWISVHLQELAPGVYLDLYKVIGVTMCVFWSKDHHHQTLTGSSLSDKYT